MTIDGLAASIASVIAMAGDEIVMPENAMMMIHDPAEDVRGTSQEMREMADVVDKVKESLVSTYAAKSGRGCDEVLSIMAAETWMSAAEAVALGFADRVEGAVRMAAHFRQLARFQNIPGNLTASGGGRDHQTPLRVDLVAEMRKLVGEAQAEGKQQLRVDPVAEIRRMLAERIQDG